MVWCGVVWCTPDVCTPSTPLTHLLSSHHIPDELVKQEGSVGGPSRGFGVELGREKGFVGVDDSLVGKVVGIQEKGLEVRGEGAGVYGKSVVLGGDVAPRGTKVDARLVHSAVAILHLVGGGTGRKSKKLVAEANSENGFGDLEAKGVLDGLDCSSTHCWVSGAVGEEEAVPGEVGGVGF